MKPFDDFETKVKEIGKIITDASEAIDKQIKVFEEAAREKKRVSIQGIYNEIVPDIQDYIPFDRIYNKKWENVATSMKSIKEEMQTVYDSTKLSISTINSMQSEKKEEALRMFKADLNLNNAISMINRFEAEKARILEVERKRAREEEERKQREEEARIRRENEERILKKERERVAEAERIRREERERIEAEKKAEEAKIIPTAPEPAREEVFASDTLSEAMITQEEPFYIEEAFETTEPFQTESVARVKTYRVSCSDVNHIALETFMFEAAINYEEI